MIKLFAKLKSKQRRIARAGAFFGLFIIFLLIFCRLAPGRLEVDYLDVGQGDSCLIKTPSGQVVLIDGGPDNEVLRRLGENLPFYRRRIDIVIMSHRHEDHITGLIEILKRYRVKRLIYSAVGDSNLTWETLMARARAEKITLSPLATGTKIAFSAACFFRFLPPATLGVKSDPNNSLIAKLSCAGQKFLWLGDNSLTVEYALLKSGWDVSADVLKVSHHGSNTASSEKFLEAVRPKVAVISVGANNKFGHPAPATVARLKALGIKIKRTDLDGTVKIRAGP